MPFSSFQLAGSDDEDDDEDEDGNDDDANPGLYKLRIGHLKVELDVVKGRLKVHGKKMDLHEVDESNGVDVELSIGAATAVENLSMQTHGHKLQYRRP